MCFPPRSPNESVRTALLLLVGLTLWTGCDRQVERFGSNDVFALSLARSRSIPTETAKVDVTEVVTELFGTPDQPRWPALIADSLPAVDSDRIRRAAGPLSSQQDGTHLGLFREHCVICHGLSGSGAGPASQVQNPYPRDFRHGVFKWKSTERSAKPTRDDLRELLLRGVPGTAMPSFALQSAEDVEALIDYVIYLSVRGEVERRLIAAAVDQLDYGEAPPEAALQLNMQQQNEGRDVIDEVLASVAEAWSSAQESIVKVPESPHPISPESIQRGKEIFHGQIANCVACHGRSGNGQAVTLDYDDWAKEYSTRLGLTPDDRDAMRPFRQAGALRPRLAQARNLRQGVFRGGGDDQSLYRRITQGIAGTPMPSVAVVDQENGKGLTEQQVWDLVSYLQALGENGATQ